MTERERERVRDDGERERERERERETGMKQEEIMRSFFKEISQILFIYVYTHI